MRLALKSFSFVSFFITFNSAQQNYVMLVENVPTHTEAYAVQGLPSTAHPLPVPNQHLSAPQSQITYVHPNSIEDGSLINAPESTAIPAVQYISSEPQLQSFPLHQPIQYALPHQSLDYRSHGIASYHQPHFSPTLDFFGAFNKHATSLLDSYIPSGLILARQRGLGAGKLFPPLSIQQHPTHTQAFYHGSHQPGYNTIAYSTYQGGGYAKRSANVPAKNTNNKKN